MSIGHFKSFYKILHRNSACNTHTHTHTHTQSLCLITEVPDIHPGKLIQSFSCPYIQWSIVLSIVSFPGVSDSKASACNVGDPGSIPGSRKSPGEGNGNPLQSSPTLLPGKSHGWKSLVGYNPWGHKESDTTERLHFHFFTLSTVILTFFFFKCNCYLFIRKLPTHWDPFSLSKFWRVKSLTK